MSRIAIGDIHGCLLTFQKALKEIKLSKKDNLILLGDYIDRQSNSKGVIDEIIKLRKEGYNIITLRGNHEDMMMKSLLGDTQMQETWMYNGGVSCLKSYGYVSSGYMNPPWESFIPEEHKQFLNECPLIFAEWSEYVFVHAGLRFHAPNPIIDSTEYEMIWERYYAVDNTKIEGRTLVTGHTPTWREQIIDMAEIGSHIIIDNGCCFNNDEYNHLCVFDLDKYELLFVKNCEEN